MGKLHEVLAVEGSLKSTSDKILKEAHHTFTQKRGHFLGQHREYEVLVENGLKLAPESKEMETTVKEKLDYVSENFKNAIDCILQKEITNTKASADLVVNGKILAKGLPATFLLTLEGKLKDLRLVYDVIPTLDPGKDWKKDTTRDNVYVSSDATQLKTQKVTEPLVLYPATEKFPAQVDKITIDKNIGQWTTKNWSGALTPTDKSKLLGKLDTLIREVKKARCRANEQEVDSSLKICSKLIDYINE